MLLRPAVIPIAPLRALTARRLRPTSTSSSTSIPSQRTWARFSSQPPPPPSPPSPASSGSPSSKKPPSANAQFYRTFGRPMAKTILIAVFTYQLAYYLWVRLEHDEIKAEMRATISDLEARIEQLERARLR